MIKVATDTIADLPADVVDEHHIHIIPAWVHLKTGKVRTDTLDTNELYDRLADEPDMPRTEPLSEAEYSEIFTDLVGKEDVLILVCASSRISQVYAIACRAAQKVSPLQVAIHDSGGVSLWQGFQAVRAAQMAAAGQDGEAILGSLGRMRRQSQFLCVLDTLAFLHKGGRVNLAQYMISLVFDIKPILSIKDGELVPVGRARGRERALVEMQFRLLESMRGLLSVWVGVVYTGASDSAHRFASQMENTLRPTYSLLAQAGPTISVHGGPNAIGVAICPSERGGTGELRERHA